MSVLLESFRNNPLTKEKALHMSSREILMELNLTRGRSLVAKHTIFSQARSI